MNIISLTTNTVLKSKNKINDFTKRFFDIIVSLLALIFLSPIFALIAWAIKRDSPGPIIYRGERFGKGGKPF